MVSGQSYTPTRGPYVKQRRIAIFIHGYNTSELGAVERYGALERNLAALPFPPNDLQLQALWWVFWPGDRSWQPRSSLSYPAQVKTAQECGKRIAQFVLDHVNRSPLESLALTIVAHSLGCRLTLEALR